MNLRSLTFAVLLSCLPLTAQIVPGGGSAPGGTITGQIQTATGGAIKGGTLTFSLSQPAIVSNTASLATTQVSCYTSTAGNIVGVPDPLALPLVSANLASGTLPAGTYYVQFFYTSANGISVASPELAFISSGTLNVNPPTLQPASATGFGVAISTSSGAEIIQGTVSGFIQFQQSQPLLRRRNGSGGQYFKLQHLFFRPVGSHRNLLHGQSDEQKRFASCRVSADLVHLRRIGWPHQCLPGHPHGEL